MISPFVIIWLPKKALPIGTFVRDVVDIPTALRVVVADKEWPLNTLFGVREGDTWVLRTLFTNGKGKWLRVVHPNDFPFWKMKLMEWHYTNSTTLVASRPLTEAELAHSPSVASLSVAVK